MATLICGSIAYDSIMTFEGRFREHILPDQVHLINLSFLVPTMRREFGGCAGNIAYALHLLGGDARIMGTIGALDAQPYLDRLDQLVQGLDMAQLATCVYGRLELPSPDGPGRLRLANAGHLPPALRTPDGQVRLLDGGVSLLVIDKGTPGFEVSRRLDKMGWRCSDTAELSFSDVRVPTGNLVGAENTGFLQIMHPVGEDPGGHNHQQGTGPGEELGELNFHDAAVEQQPDGDGANQPQHRSEQRLPGFSGASRCGPDEQRCFQSFAADRQRADHDQSPC